MSGSGKAKKITPTKRGKKKKPQKLPWTILNQDFLRDALWCENNVDLNQLLRHEKRVGGDVPNIPSMPSELNRNKVFADIDIDTDPKVMWNRLLLGRQYARLIKKNILPLEEKIDKVVDFSSPVVIPSANNKKSVIGDLSNSMGRKRKTILKTRENMRAEMSELFAQNEELEIEKSLDSDDEAESDTPLKSRQDSSGFSKQQNILVEERLRHKRETAKALLEVPILKDTTFTTFWTQFLKAHRSMYGHIDSDSDEGSFGDEVVEDDEIENEDEEDGDQVLAPGVSFLQAEELLVFESSGNEFAESFTPDVNSDNNVFPESFSGDLLPPPSQESFPEPPAVIVGDVLVRGNDITHEELLQNVKSAPPEDRAITLAEVEDISPRATNVSPRATVNSSGFELLDESLVIDEATDTTPIVLTEAMEPLAIQSQPLELRLSKGLQLFSRRRSEAVVMSLMEDSVTPGETSRKTTPAGTALSTRPNTGTNIDPFRYITQSVQDTLTVGGKTFATPLDAKSAAAMKSTELTRVGHRSYTELETNTLENSSRDIKSPGSQKFASTLSKIMKKMITMDIYDSPYLATAIFGVPVNHTPEQVEILKSREGIATAMTVSAEMVGSAPSSIQFSLIHTTENLSWITYNEDAAAADKLKDRPMKVGSASLQSSQVDGEAVVSDQIISDDQLTKASVFRFIPSRATSLTTEDSEDFVYSGADDSSEAENKLKSESIEASDIISSVSEQQKTSQAFFITHTDIAEEPSVDTLPSMSVTVRKRDMRVKFKVQDIKIQRKIQEKKTLVLDKYPIKKKGDGDYTEIRFVYQELRLHLFTYRSGKLQKFSDAHIGSIFVTNSVFIDMVTIRTTDTAQVPSGYLCTVPLEHWCAVEHEVSLCLLNMTHTTLQMHHKVSRSTKTATLGSVSSDTASSYVRSVILKPTKPQQPAPSVMSPSKLSRFKSLIPSALAVPTRVKSEIFQPLAEEETVLQQEKDPPRDFKKEIADKISLLLNCGNILSGYSAAGDVVSFEINGRHVRLWNDLMAAQKDLRISMEKFADIHMDSSKPNVYIDLSGWQTSSTLNQSIASARGTKRTKRQVKDNISRQRSAGKANEEMETSSSRPITTASNRPYSRTSVHPSLAMSQEITADMEQLDSLLHFKLAMIIDTQRLMQVYFVKKLLELDLMADVCSSFEEAANALIEDPQAYSLILINCGCLLKEGVEQSLARMLPSTLDRTTFMVAVYEVPDDDADLLEQLTVYGVNDILCEPYTTAALSVLLDSYRARQEYRVRFSRPVTTHTLIE